MSHVVFGFVFNGFEYTVYSGKISFIFSIIPDYSYLSSGDAMQD